MPNKSPELKISPNIKQLPLIPMRNIVTFPQAFYTFAIGRPRSKAAIDETVNTDGLAIFVAQKKQEIDDPKPEDLFTIGTIARIRRVVKLDGEYNVSAEGVTRVVIQDYVQDEPFFLANAAEIDETYEKTDEMEAIIRNIHHQLRRYTELGGALSLEASISILSYENPHRLVDTIASGIEFKLKDKQDLLEMGDLNDRLHRISELLEKEIKVLELGQKIASDTQSRVSKMTKEAFLREQMKTISKELGEDDEQEEINTLRKKIHAAHMPQDVEEKAMKELNRLAKMSSYNPEAAYVRTYLDWLVDMPWSVKDDSKIDIKEAAHILDTDHYGLRKIKERILEYLAVVKIQEGKMKGPIICFVGPPGVGKTSLGKSIAKALGRKFIRISLGGVRDEAEIRGHRRTYVGALPGRIIQGIKQAGTKNPVFMLDEIDKVGADYRGDPSAALLEALDPEQNNNFSDHYLEVPFDLSDVMFITTANMLDTIPPALRDRLEIINFAGYTEEEKFHIAEKYLIPKQVENHGLKDHKIAITDAAVKRIVNEYTREAGVRNLERELATVIRKIAREVAESTEKTKKTEKPAKTKQYRVTDRDLKKYLGPHRFTPFLAEKQDEVGIATGLAVTAVGGEILQVEVALMPGKGNLTMTGQLGDVMKESAQAALSYVRARAQELGIDNDLFQKTDIHIHVPEGAIPKDGPSAGITMTTALISALTKTATKKEVGMTGEITLRGRVLEIGGVKEKFLAAHRAGLKTIIFPDDNVKDLDDLPKNVAKELTLIPVKHMDEVIKYAFVKLPVKKDGKKEPGEPEEALGEQPIEIPKEPQFLRVEDKQVS